MDGNDQRFEAGMDEKEKHWPEDFMPPQPRQVFFVTPPVEWGMLNEEEFKKAAAALQDEVETFLLSGELVMALPPGVKVVSEMVMEEASPSGPKVETRGPLVRSRP